MNEGLLLKQFDNNLVQTEEKNPVSETSFEAMKIEKDEGDTSKTCM